MGMSSHDGGGVYVTRWMQVRSCWVSKGHDRSQVCNSLTLFFFLVPFGGEENI